MNTPNGGGSQPFRPGYSPLTLTGHPATPASSITATPRSTGFRRFPTAPRPSLGSHRLSWGGLSVTSSPFGGPGSPFPSVAGLRGIGSATPPVHDWLFPGHGGSTATPPPPSPFTTSLGGEIPDMAAFPDLSSTPLPARNTLAAFSPFRHAGVPTTHLPRTSVHASIGQQYPAHQAASVDASNEVPEGELAPLVERLRAWRRYALDGLMWGTAVYWGEKVLTMTNDVHDLYALCYVHIAAGNLHRAEYFLLSHPKYAPYTYTSWACRYLAALTAIHLGKYGDALWILGERPHPTSSIPHASATGGATASTSALTTSSRRLSAAAKDSRASIGGSVERRPLWKVTANKSRTRPVYHAPTATAADRDLRMAPPPLPGLVADPAPEYSPYLTTPTGSYQPVDTEPMGARPTFKMPHQAASAKSLHPTYPVASSSSSSMTLQGLVAVSPAILSADPTPTGDRPSFAFPQETPTKPNAVIDPFPLAPSPAPMPAPAFCTSSLAAARPPPMPTGPSRTVKFASADLVGGITTPPVAQPADANDWPEEARAVVGGEGGPLGINFHAAVNYLRGVAYLQQQSLIRARQCLKDAVHADVRCTEAYQLLLDAQLLTPAELAHLVGDLPFVSQLGVLDGELVRDLYLTRLSGYDLYAGRRTDPPAEASTNDLATPHPIPTPATTVGTMAEPTTSNTKSGSPPRRFGEATLNLVTRYQLQESPELWAAGAERALSQGSVHDAFALTSAVLRADPYHLATLPLHVACLYALRMKHQLFYLAHDLVDYLCHHQSGGAGAGATIAAVTASTITTGPGLGIGRPAFQRSAAPGPTTSTTLAPGRPDDLWRAPPSATLGAGFHAGAPTPPTFPHAGLASASGPYPAEPRGSAATDPGLALGRRANETSHPVPWFAVGAYYLLLGDYAQARYNFSRACTLNSRFGPAWVGFAHSFAAEGEQEPAITAYSAAARLFPGSHIIPQFIAMQYLQTDSLILAEEFLLGGLRCLVPEARLATLVQSASAQSSTATGYAKVIRTPGTPRADPTTPSLTRADLLSGGDHPPLALGLADLAKVVVSPSLARDLAGLLTHAQFLNELGVLAYKQARYPVALIFLTRAEQLLLHPDRELDTAVAALLAGPSDSIPQDVSPAKQTPATTACPARPLGPNSVYTTHGAVSPATASGLETAWTNLGHVYRKLTDYPRAVAYYEQVLTLAPNDHDVLTALAMVHHICGRLDEAIMLYHQSLSVAPVDPTAAKLLHLALEHSSATRGLPGSLTTVSAATNPRTKADIATLTTLSTVPAPVSPGASDMSDEEMEIEEDM
ncbi:anaphase-promoting complex subunit Cut9 [Tieghemiomyces parasiticus]|uniref:Anaphase-promoting complex subunit Cut9 n=1 Tax=Tieghemiomyces parasiticus TaxID=78921 RepID=A0A9W8AA28_9FUNG|nr:anaphase-promoting complex subunit Cut9 [Tieghemiomyces parasiticus]